MSFVSISDIHIKSPNDDAHSLFLRFLGHEKTNNANEIYLLGDIFDLMIGDNHQYLDKFSEIFSKFKEHIQSGKTIYYFEGNHDFHLKKLLKRFCEKNSLDSNKLIFIKGLLRKNIDGKNFVFCHGDEIQIGSFFYKLYRFSITSPLLAPVANYVFPYKLIHMIGDNASKKSRARNKKKYDSDEARAKIKKIFRDSANKLFTKKSFDYLLCGHCHVKDSFSNANFTYFNNGYVKKDKTFISYNGDIAFIDIN